MEGRGRFPWRAQNRLWQVRQPHEQANADMLGCRCCGGDGLPDMAGAGDGVQRPLVRRARFLARTLHTTRVVGTVHQTGPAMTGACHGRPASPRGRHVHSTPTAGTTSPSFLGTVSTRRCFQAVRRSFEHVLRECAQNSGDMLSQFELKRHHGIKQRRGCNQAATASPPRSQRPTPGPCGAR